MLRILMSPSNRLCDAIGVEDEHERGLIRQLVNALALGLLAVPLFWGLWTVVA
jgi:hypothetical protein